uniref:Uncharacterized protein n=1 Tax=Cannabis sativa TaxID=3483 RepID=A0A803QDS7_CANSA
MEDLRLESLSQSRSGTGSEPAFCSRFGYGLGPGPSLGPGLRHVHDLIPGSWSRSDPCRGSLFDLGLGFGSQFRSSLGTKTVVQFKVKVRVGGRVLVLDPSIEAQVSDPVRGPSLSLGPCLGSGPGLSPSLSLGPRFQVRSQVSSPNLGPVTALGPSLGLNPRSQVLVLFLVTVQVLVQVWVRVWVLFQSQD